MSLSDVRADALLELSVNLEKKFMKSPRTFKWHKIAFFFRSRDDNVSGLPINQAVWLLALPTSLRLLGHFLFEIVDAFWVGELGKEALAAVGGVSLYIWGYYALGFITLTGLNTMIAQTVGAGRGQEGVRLAGIGLAASLLWAIVFIGAYVAAADSMLAVLGLEGQALAYGYDYLLPFILASPIFYLWCVFEEILNARGQTQLNFTVMLASITLNTVLDPLLIQGYGPFPKWEVAGAQVASILSATLGAFLTGYFCFRRKYIRSLDFDWRVFWTMAKIGFPRVIGSLVFCLTYVGLAYLIQRFGQEALAAWMVCHRLEGFAYYLSLGFSTAATVMVAQYIGAGRQQDIRKAVLWNIIWISLVLAVNTGVLIVLGRTLIMQFSGDAKVLQYGTAYLTIVAITHVFMGWELVLGGAFSGMGNTLPQIYVIAPLTVSRIPLSCLLIPFWGINGVFWAISLTTLLKGIAMTVWFVMASRKQIQAIDGGRI